MRNINNTLLYALIGALLSAMFAFTLINYLGNQNSDFTEKASFLVIYLSPIIIIGGIILGVTYARKYKK